MEFVYRKNITRHVTQTKTFHSRCVRRSRWSPSEGSRWCTPSPPPSPPLWPSRGRSRSHPAWCCRRAHQRTPRPARPPPLISPPSLRGEPEEVRGWGSWLHLTLHRRRAKEEEEEEWGWSRRRASTPAPRPSPRSASTRRSSPREEEEEAEEREEPEPLPPLPLLLRCPPTPNNSSARHPSPCHRSRLTLRHLLHKVPGFSTLAAWSSGPPTHRSPPPPLPLLTLPAPDVKPSSLQQRPNLSSWRETGRKKAQKGAKTCRRAAEEDEEKRRISVLLLLLLFMDNRKGWSATEREKNNFCTLTSVYTHRLSLSLSFSLTYIKNNTFNEKLKLKWTSAVWMFVCSMPVRAGACFRNVLI